MVNFIMKNFKFSGGLLMKKNIKITGAMIIFCLITFFTTSCDGIIEQFKAPTGVVATKLSNGNIHITWNAVSGAKLYTICYRTDLDSTSTRRPVGTSNITTYTHTNYVTIDVTTLYYYVKAQNKDYSTDEGFKESVYSSPASVNIK